MMPATKTRIIMFERFSETARRTLYFARHETTELGGMAIEANTCSSACFARTKDRHPIYSPPRTFLTPMRGPRSRHTGGVRPQVPTSEELPFSDETERILQYATEEADRLGHEYIGTGHLLLGVLREDGSFAAGMLGSHGMTIEDLRQHIVDPPVVPEPAHEAPAEGGRESVKREAFDPVVSLERIRWLAEELRSQAHVDDTRILVDEIHRHLDALKRHLA
jgi:ATP-dependent Clp protease ATP-binding subunit ClpC